MPGDSNSPNATPEAALPSKREQESSPRSSQDGHGTQGPNDGSPYSPPRHDKVHPRLGLVPQQTDVSIFSGKKDQASISPKSLTRPSGPLSPEVPDRVFPVRSVVSVDPSATPQPQSFKDDFFAGFVPAQDRNLSRMEGGKRRNTLTDRSPSLGAQMERSNTQDSRTSTTQSQDTPAQRRMSEDRSSNSSRTYAQGLSQLMRDDASMKSIGSEGAMSREGNISESSRGQSRTGSLRDAPTGLLTARFKHVVTENGHAVITGRDGETLQRCEDEPIHIPGAIQSFGILIALREEAGKLVVRVVSENAAQIVGYTPEQLFKLDSFLDILTDEQADNLLDHLDFIRDEESADPAVNGPEVFMLSIRPPKKRAQKLWCAMHINPNQSDLIIIEFEPEEDVAHPLVPPSENNTPEPPEDTLGSRPTPEEYAESTVNLSRPLRVLRSARKKKGEAAAMEVFNIMSQVQEQLANARDLDRFLRVLIGVIKELTGFHRVMIYQFDQSWNGRVVSELVDPRATKDLYKGLHFPASDIPKQARDLYKVNKVRLLYDRDQETARLVCRTLEDLEHPLDLTYSYLRAMSPIHIKYLANMAVRSSMSVSINAFDELWGLISCHSYGYRGMRVSFPIRKMCRLVGDTASRNIERLSYASRLQARKLINTVPTDANPSGYIIASSEDLLQLFDADLGTLCIRGETKVLGKSDGNLQEILAMLEYLKLRKLTSVFTTQDAKEDLPDFRYAPGLRFIAGLLYVPLSPGGVDFIVFFRKGQLREVKWAGNPYEKFVKEGTEGYLEPRKSFKVWSETIIGKCRDWSQEEIETAAVLCLVYGKFIEVWRQKEAALQNSQLTRLLLANSAHEVRTPLNAIINYLEIALEGPLDTETRDNLAKSHSASKSLIYVINDLLDLTKAEEGQELVKDEVFDLTATLKQATEPFERDAKRKGIEYLIEYYPGLPSNVIGDPRRVRQALSNIISNAIQNTSAGSVKVDVWVSTEQSSPDKHEIEMAVEDTGVGMSAERVDALFRDLEQVSYDESDNPVFGEASQEKAIDSQARTLGLGLAIVARTVRTMNGQLRVKSEEGQGSRFVVIIGFETPSQDTKGFIEAKTPEEIERSPMMPSTPSTAHVQGEVTLVRSLSRQQRSPEPMVRRESTESVKSVHSVRSSRSINSLKSALSQSSQKSDVDRLIDALQEPHIPGDSKSDKQEKARIRPSSSGGASTSSHLSVKPSSSLKSALAKVPGQEVITDSGMPLKAVRVPEEEQSARESRHVPKVSFDTPTPSKLQTQGNKADKSSSKPTLSILVAEDDPINSRIIKKRLEKLGHTIHHTVNGEDCAHAHAESSTAFDVVLMDLQMPIVDGFSSTKMIRSFEKTKSSTCLSSRARANGRIPIFAVSASLVEKDREKYIDVGFDGWILKPIDFKRVELLLQGIIDDQPRKECVYQPGKWEDGGWFSERQDDGHDRYSSNTAPDESASATEFKPPQAMPDK
ncbi:MAG: hypothetical protein Q9160_007617 [Pyrenula sp. 1 TL-2023]